MFKVRPAIEEDVPRVQDIWGHKLNVNMLGGPSFREELKGAIKKDRLAVADLDGYVVGFCKVSDAIPQRLALTSLAIDPEYYNQGISEKLYFYWAVKNSFRYGFFIDDHIMTSENLPMVLWMAKMRFKRTICMRARTRSSQDYAFYTLDQTTTDWWDFKWVQEEMSRLDEYEFFETPQDEELRKKMESRGLLERLTKEESESVLENFQRAREVVSK